MTNRENLSQFVERIMRQKGLKAADVERGCGKRITGSYISRIIKGKVTNLTVEAIIALARGLDVDPYDIFAASYGKPPQIENRLYSSPDPMLLVDTMERLVKQPEMLEMLQKWMHLMPERREALRQMLDYMSEERAGLQRSREKSRRRR